MPRKLTLTVLIGLCLIGAVLSAASPTLYLSGESDDSVVQPEFGIFLLGGATEPDEGMAWLLEKANGGDVVVLRASGSDGYNSYFFGEIGGVHSVRSYVFSSREEAFDDAMLDSVENAELIFLAGGDQSKYVRFWKGTPLQTLLNQHVRQGKPIGGTSAGLAVLGGVAYSAMADSIRSSTALKDPFSEDLTLEADFLQVPLLRGIVTDSHFSERGRLGRMLAFQAWGRALRDGQPLIGMGVDESTALAIDASGQGRVFSRLATGRVYLSVYDGSTEVTLEPGKPLSVGPILIIGLDRNSSIQFPSLEISKPNALSFIEVAEGRIREIDTQPRIEE
jgi:beta-aspartyl-peptidase (threonine type)